MTFSRKRARTVRVADATDLVDVTFWGSNVDLAVDTNQRVKLTGLEVSEFGSMKKLQSTPSFHLEVS